MGARPEPQSFVAETRASFSAEHLAYDLIVKRSENPVAWEKM